MAKPMALAAGAASACGGDDPDSAPSAGARLGRRRRPARMVPGFVVCQHPDWFRWPARAVTPEDIERFERLQKLEREGEQAVR